MLYPQIAQRTFNTPLLVEPGKAMAFLSGLGPRILGRRLEFADETHLQGLVETAALPARAGILANGLAEDYHRTGDALYAVVDSIAVIDITGTIIHRGSWIGESSGQTSCEGIAAQMDTAVTDPAIRGIALEIDSFGGEVAGIFDLADRIRAVRRHKPVWAFVAEHAFSAGYALASQADRILLPRTGAVGSIGVVVIHADLSERLGQEGVRITLIHSGRHKVDGNSYEPLPEPVRGDIQREIDMLRRLFAETVAAGRSGRMNAEAALVTEAMIYRGADAVAAGLADEVTNLANGFAEFRQRVARNSVVSFARMQRTTITHAGKEAAMAHNPGQDDAHQETEENQGDGVPSTPEPETIPTPGAQTTSAVSALPGASRISPSAAEPTAVSSTPPVARSSVSHANPDQPSSLVPQDNIAQLSAQLRQEAAEIAGIAAQATRLGIAIDTASALRDGTTPEALRKLVLERAAAAADASDIIAAPPSPVLPQVKESPIVAAAKRAAANTTR